MEHVWTCRLMHTVGRFVHVYVYMYLCVNVPFHEHVQSNINMYLHTDERTNMFFIEYMQCNNDQCPLHTSPSYEHVMHRCLLENTVQKC